MATILASLRDDYIRKDGTVNVLLITYLKRKKIRINTNVSVFQQDWDTEKGRVRRSDKEHSTKNLIIDNCHKRITEIFVKYRLKHLDLTPGDLLSEYKIKSTYISFYEFTDHQLKIRKGEIEPGTIKLQTSNIKKLKDYAPNLRFSEIDEKFIGNYEKYLRQTLHNKINTIWLNLKTIKTYLSIAQKLGIIDNNPFSNYKLKTVRTEITFLSEADVQNLMQLYKSEELDPGLHNVLHYYLFACFTGFRISDVKRITVDNIINDMIILQPKKTKNTSGKIVYIPINKPIRDLLKPLLKIRYSGVIFRTFSDQVTNRHLKTIAAKAKINQVVNFKTARHTFATLYLKYNPGDLVGLQNLLGHTKIIDTMVYAHIHPADLNNRMNNFNALF